MLAKFSTRVRLAVALAVASLTLATQVFGASAAAEPCYDANRDGLWQQCAQGPDVQQAPATEGGGNAVFRAM